MVEISVLINLMDFSFSPHGVDRGPLKKYKTPWTQREAQRCKAFSLCPFKDYSFLKSEYPGDSPQPVWAHELPRLKKPAEKQKRLLTNLREKGGKIMRDEEGRRESFSNRQFSNYILGKFFFKAAWYISIFKIMTYT